MLPALGIAILMQLIFDKNNAAYLFVGFVLSAIFEASTIAVAIVGGIIAYIIYQETIKHKSNENNPNTLENNSASSGEL